VLLAETEPTIRRLAELTWAAALRNESRIARTVVLKLKTAEFKILTRSHTPSSPPSSCKELTAIALSLRERLGSDRSSGFVSSESALAISSIRRTSWLNRLVRIIVKL